MAWTAKVVDVDGNVYGTLSDAARIGTITQVLNGAGTVDITLPTSHADTALLLPGREVQILNGADVVLWGPIVRPKKTLRQSTWQIAGCLWYLGRRHMGRADRVNLLTNGDFEAGETGWSFAGGVTHSIDTVHFVEGTQSLELEGATDDHDSYAHQTYTHNQSHPEGDYLTLSAYVYVSGADYLGGAISDRGLLIVHRNAAGKALNYDVAEIGDATVNNEWIPLEVGVPYVKQDDTVQVVLYPPHGVAYWDLVTLTAMESLSFGYPDGVDVATVIEGIVLYAQDLGPFTHGKSDLNIAVDAAATGVLKEIAYQFAEHRNILDALMEYVRRGVVDIDMVYTTTTRTLTTYTPKGSLFGTTLELDVNLADFTWSWDGERAAGDVVVLGEGDGPDRPEGGATDPTFLNGITLEIVESAADDVTVGELDQQAAETLTVAKNPEIFDVVTMPGAGIIGNIHTGDTVSVLIPLADIDDVYRVVSIAIDPYMDQATITLNVT